MSLTTVAAPVPPDPTLARLPASHSERFQRSDFIAAGIVAVVTLGVYIATLAPNVTLEDSGELITAAAKFGVGHPPGYPFWTMMGFAISHLLPFGGLAWRVNLLSAIFGAASNGVLTLLVCHSGRWLLQRWTLPEEQAAVRPYVFYAGMLAGLTIGFSDVMWSQAVISAVHGTLNALFINLVLLFFYLWMIEPQRTHRLIFAVFVFAIGLTNHHTLVQIIPAFLLGALLLPLTPAILHKTGQATFGTFFSVFMAVLLFSLSLLVYISWLSGDNELQTISQVMAWGIFIFVAVISFIYLREFRLKFFLLGVATAAAIFAFSYYLLDPGETAGTARYPFSFAHLLLTGSFVHPGWLQGLVANAHAGHVSLPRKVEPLYGWMLLAVAAVALGLLYSSRLDRRLVIGVFAVGWIGLMPYAYLPFASATHPPMNWGYASERAGFYYAVSREQYPKSLPILIKTTFGKLLGVVSKDANLDSTIGLPNYSERLWKTIYYYGDNLQQNFTVPLIFLTLAVLLYLWRCDWPQVNWLIFLGAAFFFIGFMLHIIAPQEGFDLEHMLQYRVFHLQSHCIFVVLMGYGALAAMVYLREIMPDYVERTGVPGFGVPALVLCLLPFWSNFDDCSQAGHWFGYEFGADIMGPMDKNAVYFGGSDPGRFVPTYMAFVESQQNNYWKRDPNFDRRDVTVVTQNALCDTYYSHYIRDQYDARFRPKPGDWTPFERWLGRDKAYPEVPVTCVSHDELLACWEEYQARPEVTERVAMGQPAVRLGSNDVFEVNGIVAKKIFDKNKKDHTFYIEQSVPIDWMYPYLEPWHLIFKLNPDPVKELPRDMIDRDVAFWDAYSAKLLSDPLFHLDPFAQINFSKLAFWHSDLYGYRKMPKEQEHFLKMALQLCPQCEDAVNAYAHMLADQQRYDDAVAMVKQAVSVDPRNDFFADILTWLEGAQVFAKREKELDDQIAKSPYDIDLHSQYARLLQDEGKFPELDDELQLMASLTNWNHADMAGVVEYYVNTVHNPEAAIAFLEAREKLDPTSSELAYGLAALDASVGKKEEAIRYLQQAVQLGGTNAAISAHIDARFASVMDDPRFRALMTTNSPATNAPSTNAAPPRALPVTNAPAASTTVPATKVPATNAPARPPAAGVQVKPPQKDTP